MLEPGFSILRAPHSACGLLNSRDRVGEVGESLRFRGNVTETTAFPESGWPMNLDRYNGWWTVSCGAGLIPAFAPTALMPGLGIKSN